MHTISPAIGPYTIEVFTNIDKFVAGSTGISPTGMGPTGIGAGTLEPVEWMMGYTGISQNNFTNDTRVNY